MRIAFRLAAFSILLSGVAAKAQTPEEKQATVDYLLSLKSPTGGYAETLYRPNAVMIGELRPTAAVVRALVKFGGKAVDGAGDIEFIGKCFHEGSGGFASVPGGTPEVPTTAIALMTLADMKVPLEKYQAPCVKYLMSKDRPNIEDVRFAAAAVEALQAKMPNVADWLRAVNQSRSAEGVWGNGPCAARETASMASTIIRFGTPLTSNAAVIKLLKEKQQPDGGYCQDPKGSDLESCYRVVKCLTLLKEKVPEADKMRTFIERCRNRDGGYGTQPNRPSSASATYYAAYVLDWIK